MTPCPPGTYPEVGLQGQTFSWESLPLAGLQSFPGIAQMCGGVQLWPPRWVSSLHTCRLRISGRMSPRILCPYFCGVVSELLKALCILFLCVSFIKCVSYGLSSSVWLVILFLSVWLVVLWRELELCGPKCLRPSLCGSRVMSAPT